MRSRILPVADLLMAAAHADRHMEVEEIDRIEALLARILEPEASGPVSLPSQLRQHMEDFRPEDFSMEATVGPFLHEDTAFKRKLLEMVVSIHESDGELDFLEDTFVRELGFKLGLADEEYADLCLRFLEDEGEEDMADSPAETHGFSRPTSQPELSDLDKTEVVDRKASLASAPTPVPGDPSGAEHEWSFEAVSTGSAQPVLARAETATYASPGTWEGPPASSEPLPSVDDQALYELVFRTVDLFLSQHPALRLTDQQREDFAEGAWGAFSALVPKVRTKKKTAKKKTAKRKAAKNTAKKKTAKKTAKKKAAKKTAKKKAAKKTAKKKATKKTAKKKATKKTAKKKAAKKKRK